MNDLRIINIDSNNIVTARSDLLNIPLDLRDGIVQRVYIALINTPGTMIDYVDFGGGANNLLFAKSPKTETEGRLRVADVVRATSESLSDDPDILSVDLIEYVRKTRGFSAKLKINTRSLGSIEVEI